ncbi:MAG: hypothetical protein JNK15_21520 [Planctomycetes bacterium]|nr:hypothetical protein [Planctomycetota bacterium]
MSYALVPSGRAPLLRGLAFPRSFALAAAAALPVPLAAQQVHEGLTNSPLALAANASLAHVVPGGLVTFGGGSVSFTPNGQPPQVLLTTTGTVFGSFLQFVAPNHVLFGLTQVGGAGANDVVWLLPLQGPPATAPLANIRYDYDVALRSPTEAFVSARLGGFASPDGDIVALDLTNGTTRHLAQIPGASGPVAVAPNGDVYYAPGYAGWPPLPGTVSVLRFPRPVVDQALLLGTTLGLADAQTVLTGLDAVADFAFDDDGDLHFVDWWNNRVGEISDVQGPIPWLGASIAGYSSSGLSPTMVQFVAGSGGGEFEPFQPANGRMFVHATDYAAVNELHGYATSAATLGHSGPSPIPSGPFSLLAGQGPANGIGVVAFQFGAQPGTTLLAVPGFEQTLAIANSLLTSPILVAVPFDAAGNMPLALVNPGYGVPVTASVQVVFVAQDGVLGATVPTTLVLGP